MAYATLQLKIPAKEHGPDHNGTRAQQVQIARVKLIPATLFATRLLI